MNQWNGKPASDYRTADILEVSKPTISKYRRHGSTFDDNTALKVAALLDIDPAVIFADMQTERAKSEDARNVWQNIAESLRNQATTAAILSAVFYIAFSLSPIESGAYIEKSAQTTRVNLILCQIVCFFIHLLAQPSYSYHYPPINNKNNAHPKGDSPYNPLPTPNRTTNK